MKIKKILILLLILSILINISCMHAAENTTDVLSESNENNIYVDVNNGDDNNTGDTWQTPVQSIEKAINLTNNKTTNIYLNNGTYTGKNNTNITIKNKNTINIIGFANTIINGENKNHIFTITNNTKVTLQNITFTNAYIKDTQSKASALNIENNTEIIIENCQFINNTLQTQVKNNENLQTTGGAINAENNVKITIKDSIFNKNTGANGGAINIQNTTEINLINNTFTNNKAITNNLIKNTSIIIEHIDHNTISYTDYSNAYLEESYGGAIYLENNTNIKIINNKLTNNTANNGGAITLKNNKNTQINNITITDNKLTSTRKQGSSYTSHYDLTTSEYGNSIYINNTTATINKITLKNNNGGLGSIKIDNSNVIIKNSNLTSNTATKGGAIYNEGNLTIINTTFTNNKGYANSGSIHLTTIKNLVDGVGGDIYNKGYAIITNSTLTNTDNFTLTGIVIGGSIYNKGTMILNNTEISNKKSGEYSYGAAISNMENLTIINSIIKDNIVGLTSYSVANFFSGAIFNEGLLTATKTIFQNNLATGLFINKGTASYSKGSGNIYSTQDGKLNITNSIFINKHLYRNLTSTNPKLYLETKIMQDIYNLGEVISLENNFWKGETPNINQHTKYDKINNYYTIELPEYIALDINESKNITLNIKNTYNQNTNELPFKKLNITINTTINGENKILKNTITNKNITFEFNYTQEKGNYPITLTFQTKARNIEATDKTYEFLIECGKEHTNMNITLNNTLEIGQNLTLDIKVTGNYTHQPTGNITVYLTDITTYKTKLVSQNGHMVEYYTKHPDQKYILNLNNTEAHLNTNITDAAGYAKIKIVYEGDEDYFKNFYYNNITINKKNPELKIEIPEVYVGGEIQINVSKAPESESSTGYLYIDGTKWSKVIFNTDNITLSYKKTYWLNNYGNYTIKITYDKTENYQSSSVTGTLIVKRYESNLTINASDIMIGENLTINATLTPNTVPGGNANITINNQTNPLFLNQGTKQINISNLKAGTYNITINYFGTNKYAPATATTTINVHKYTSNLTVNRTNYDNLTGTITVNAYGTGNVTLWINNKNYTQKIIDNTTTFHITYNNGTNYIFIYYTGDEYYQYATWNTTENITYKYFLKAENMTYYQNENFNYTITLLNGELKPLEDYVNITFQNTLYRIKTDKNGTIQFPLKLQKGTYNITIQYNQTTLNNIINITAADTYPEMNISTNNITYGEDLTANINITPKATGTVTIQIDRQTQTVNIIQGYATATFKNITCGAHTITATYNGDNKYRIITQEKTVTIHKANTTIKITTGNITLGENIYIYAHTNRNDATGQVTFTIKELYNPRNRTLTDNKATWYISPLERGQYTITAKYNGDTNYNPSTATYTLTVEPEINITTKSIIEYGDTIEIEISTTPIPGKINIEIDTINETVNLTDGEAKINIKNTLNPGNYTIKTTLISENYSKTIQRNLTVTKANPIKDMTIKDILAGEREEIQITLKDNTLKYKIQVDNKNYDTLNITIPGLTKGEHTLHIEITGNENYTDINQTIRFHVKSYKSSINITAANITYGEDLKIKATITENATGNITYTIADQTITTEDKEILIKNIPAGTYNLTVTYNGNTYYQSSTTTQTVEVKKAESTIVISTGEIIPGENIFIYATTNNGTTGNVTFRIIGQFSPRNKTLENNTATWYIESLPRGIYTITAKYNGNSNYKASNATYILAIDPEINMTIKTQDTEYAEEITIEAITDLNGIINFQIENINENITIVNGKATLKINSPLNTGTYTVYATYINKNFQSETINATQKIIKTTPIKDITIKDILAGETEEIQITLKDYSLKYKVSVDNKEYNTLDITIPGLTKGEHTLHIEVTGNDNYRNVSETIKFYGKTQKSSINITAANITYGEDLNVKATITENATGNITYTIADQTITTEDKEILIKNIPAGTYNLTVTYNGNTYYQSSTTTQIVEVKKAEPEINITVDAKSSEDPINISVKLNPDVTGIITYRINGVYSPRNHTLANGEDSWLIESLDNGEYELVVTYNGDTNYNKKQIIYLIHINQIKTHLTANLTVNPDNSVTVTAELTSDDNNTLNADITLAVANKFYKMKINNGKGLYTTPILSNGDYRYTLAYAGTPKYTSANTQGAFSIKDYIQLNVTTIINDDDTVTFNITLNKAENLTLTINDKEYLLEISGTKVFTTPKLTPGKYNYTVKYDGDDNTHPANKTGTLTIKTTPEILYTIEVNPDNSITLKINTTIQKGNLTLEINNKNYLVRITNNTGLYTTPILENGNYTYNIIYDGDKNTKNLTQTGKLTIKNNAILTAKNLIKYYSDPERLNITLTYKNQPLTNEMIYITINGVTYKRTTDNNGKVSMAINLNSGTYNATLTFNNTEYNTINKKIIIQIKNTVYGNDITKVYRNDTQYYAIFTDSTGKLLKNTPVTFNINGVFYTRTTNDQGIAKLNINLPAGQYILTAINPVTNENYANKITVLSKIQENKDLTKYYRNDTQYIIKIIKPDGTAAGAGEKVTFNINGVFYERYTNETGHVKLNINLQPGTYIITAEYDGCRISNNITVLTILKANNLAKKYTDKLPFTATLLDGQGNPYKGQTLTFNINGVIYERTTNDYGLAKLNINLQPGKYIITTTYNNLNTANIVTIRS